MVVPRVAFPRGQWYVAAYSREVGGGLLARTVCGEPLVLYRTRAGEAVALADRCAHRRFPLSRSRRDGDRIVCGYHGFTYAPDGVCVAVPGQVDVPRAARVAAYRVVEQDSLVWVWIGDGEGGGEGDAAAIPRAPWLDSPGHVTVRGVEHVGARHGLLIDNLLDLSHEAYLHPGLVGTPEAAQTPTTTEVDEDAGVVYVSRRVKDVECPPYYAESMGFDGRIDRWQDIEYHPPCLYVLHTRVAPAGIEPTPAGDVPGARHTWLVHAVTPETETTTHDFWMVARDFALDEDAGREEVSAYLAESDRAMVLQDARALHVLEEAVAADPEDGGEVSVNADTGGLAARRILRRQMTGRTEERSPAARVRSG